jgi:hypothetical protein
MGFLKDDPSNSDIYYSTRGVRAENSAHAHIPYKDMWHVPLTNPYNPENFYSSDNAAIKPERHKNNENNDQVRRILAKMLPLQLLLSEHDYQLYKYNSTWSDGTCIDRILRNPNAYR